jgi:predicted HTH domain antitoxin
MDETLPELVRERAGPNRRRSMAILSLDVPDDLVNKLSSTGTEAGPILCLAAAFSLCSRGELSTSQAARLAGLTYADFLEAAARAKVELFPVDLAELKEEISRGFTMGRQRVTDHSAGQNRPR